METKPEEFEFVYVENDGTVRELDMEEIKYLQTEFEPTDGARPYIKSSYNQLTPDKKIWGYLHRSNVPRNMDVKKTDNRYLEFGFPININDSNKIIELTVGIYSIKVLGGWDVIVGDFTFSLKNIKNGKIINPRATRWKTQSYEFGKRAKRIMTLDIPERGNYSIAFKNQESLKLWKAGLPFIYRLFRQPISKELVQIVIK